VGDLEAEGSSPIVQCGGEGILKEKIRIFFTQQGSERRLDLMSMDNFYYECIYEVLRITYPQG